ncbi:MAG: IS66 family insertion sequence element accessory protein TnpB [Desulfobulbaceae bacterium]|nr:IS66 family insertion sequence element accessory protein TnpB [Desulfobulbaceae bacterium]
MKLLPDHNMVFLAIGHTDMRKSFNGLSLLVTENYDLDPFSGNLFAFCNRRRDIIKILFWNNNGFCIWHKRLEKDKFFWPDSELEVVNIDFKQMSWLLAGLEIDKAHKSLFYNNI